MAFVAPIMMLKKYDGHRMLSMYMAIWIKPEPRTFKPQAAYSGSFVVFSHMHTHTHSHIILSLVHTPVVQRNVASLPAIYNNFLLLQVLFLFL